MRAIMLSSTAYTHCCAEVSPVDPLAEYDDEELEAGAAGQELLEASTLMRYSVSVTWMSRQTPSKKTTILTMRATEACSGPAPRKAKDKHSQASTTTTWTWTYSDIYPEPTTLLCTVSRQPTGRK